MKRAGANHRIQVAAVSNPTSQDPLPTQNLGDLRHGNVHFNQS